MKRKNTFTKVELSESEIALEETNVTAFIEREEKKTEAPATIETVDSKDIEQADYIKPRWFLARHERC